MLELLPRGHSEPNLAATRHNPVYRPYLCVSGELSPTHSSQGPVATFTRDHSLMLRRMPAPEGVEQSLEHEDLYVERFGQSHGSIKEELHSFCGAHRIHTDIKMEGWWSCCLLQQYWFTDS